MVKQEKRHTQQQEHGGASGVCLRAAAGGGGWEARGERQGRREERALQKTMWSVFWGIFHPPSAFSASSFLMCGMSFRRRRRTAAAGVGGASLVRIEAEQHSEAWARGRMEAPPAGDAAGTALRSAALRCAAQAEEEWRWRRRRRGERTHARASCPPPPLPRSPQRAPPRCSAPSARCRSSPCIAPGTP